MSSGRLYKETLIRSTDKLLGTVRLVGGKPHEGQLKKVEKKLEKLREKGRGKTIKTWRAEKSLEFYISD